MKNVALPRLVVSSVLLAVLIFSLDYKWGSLPRIAPFFSPFHGFWMQAAGTNAPTGTLNFGMPGLEEAAEVSYDSLGVPHVFAQNDHDLYFMQGFVTARDRLWQMEIQTYASAGRLSELLGADMLDYDRFQRRLGMVYGARKLLEHIKSDSVSFGMVQAYTEGVNAWIAQLDDPRKFPIEYKLLDIAPEPWTELKSALLLMNMTYTLAGYSRDVAMTKARMAFGQDWVNKYLLERTPLMDPIVPSQAEWEQWQIEPTPRPVDADSVPAVVESIFHIDPEEGNGSNNWAVSGKKTASGYPILANDPHLNMTAPSIWYQIQLHAPGVNTVGASIPGAPTVIIGFNERIAWGVTNVDADVLDYYALKQRQPTPSRLEYFYEGEWKEAEAQVETYNIRGEEAITERVFYTHHGPVIPDNDVISLRSNEVGGVAVKWIGHHPTDIFKTFYRLNRATNYEEYVASLTTYSGPAQNFVFAAQDGDIALWINGKFPKKWEGQGRYILDGTRADHDWPSYIDHQQNPHMHNPERQFVSSANQRSTAENYPYWLQDSQASFSRGRRINDQLRQMNAITVQDMMELQMDDFNYTAYHLLPEMLKRLGSAASAVLIEELSGWNFHHQAEERAPAVWQAWHDALYDRLTMDERRAYGNYRPTKDMMMYCILNEADSTPWFDDIETEAVESLDDMIALAWQDALKTLEQKLGEDQQAWKWTDFNKIEIKHIAQIPGLGLDPGSTSGSALSVNAIRAPSHGPSWRMVVELGPEVKGYGIYPGGQSGNPGSPFYDNMLNDWTEGRLQPISFYRTVEQARANDRFSIYMRADRKDALSTESTPSTSN